MNSQDILFNWFNICIGLNFTSDYRPRRRLRVVICVIHWYQLSLLLWSFSCKGDIYCELNYLALGGLFQQPSLFYNAMIFAAYFNITMVSTLSLRLESSNCNHLRTLVGLMRSTNGDQPDQLYSKLVELVKISSIGGAISTWVFVIITAYNGLVTYDTFPLLAFVNLTTYCTFIYWSHATYFAFLYLVYLKLKRHLVTTFHWIDFDRLIINHRYQSKLITGINLVLRNYLGYMVVSFCPLLCLQLAAISLENQALLTIVVCISCSTFFGTILIMVTFLASKLTKLYNQKYKSYSKLIFVSMTNQKLQLSHVMKVYQKKESLIGFQLFTITQITRFTFFKLMLLILRYSLLSFK